MLLVDLLQDRELEDVDQLVVDHVLEFRVGARVRKHHAPLRELGESLHALGEEAGADVGLLEVLVRGIDDQRDRLRDLVLEFPLEVLIAVLGERERQAGERLLLRVIEDLHVLAAQRLPLKRVVVDLVLAERERLGVGKGRRRNTERDREQTNEELHLLHSQGLGTRPARRDD
jgi:hypothetical protein